MVVDVPTFGGSVPPAATPFSSKKKKNKNRKGGDPDKQKFGTGSASNSQEVGEVELEPKTVLSKTEQLARISEWEVSVDKNPDATDFETKTSALVDEGVRTLKNWDNEVVSIRHLEAEKAKQAAAAKRHTPEELARQNTARLELVSDLHKIKKYVDPNDHITPRIMISEFEKYIASKRMAPPSTAPETIHLNLPKRVQFDHPPLYPPTRQQHPQEGLFSSTTPGRKPPPPVPTDLRLQRPGALTQRFSIAPSSSPRTSSAPPGPKLQGPDPDWWRRKIRQGMMQTEMLMSELVRQRREDERYYHGTNPYFYGLEQEFTRAGYNSNRINRTALTATPYPRAVSEEENRLQSAIQASRRLHQKCFGSCPPSAVNTARVEESSKVIKPVKLVHAGSATDDDVDTDYEDDDGPTSVGTLMRSYPKLVTRSTQQDPPASSFFPKTATTATAATTTKSIPAAMNDDVKVIFERSGTFPGEDVKVSRPITTTKISQSVNKPIPVSTNKLPVVEEKAKPKPIVVVTTKKQDPSSKSRSANPEWVQRLVEAQKNHETKEQLAAQKRVEAQHEAHNALYKELRRNKSRLENEVNLEKRRMALNWRLLKHDKTANPSSASTSTDSLRFHSKSGKQRGYSPKHLHNEVDPKDQGKKNKNKLKDAFPRWKETPKGLSIWLEDVVAKAKEQKDKDLEREQQQLRHRKKTPPPKVGDVGWTRLNQF